jgi:capsular polysaccharide transport system permease protein
MINKISLNSFRAALLAIFLFAIYWGAVASDRYVSEAHVIVDRTDFSGIQSMDFTALLTGKSNSNDLMLLRDHLLSVDMLAKLDARLDLRSHYNDRKRDILSRMWFRDASQEFFHRHYLSRVSIELDSLSGVLRIISQAYTPDMAQAITKLLVDEGEKFINEMGHRLAREQVDFLERQVAEIYERLMKTRKAALDFQNANGIVSPQGAVETLAAIVARIEGQIVELKGKREAMLGYLSPKAPDIAQINMQIAALEKQLALEKARLTSTQGQTLNRLVEEYQRLEMEAEFAQSVYNTALIALEKGRVDATRTLKKVSIVQSPTLPQYPIEPKRIYNIFVFSLSLLMMTGIIHLITAVIRDHRD